MRDNKYGIFNFMEVQALLHDMKISKFRNFQVNLKGRTDGNRLTKIACWDFCLQIWITSTR